MPSPSDPARVRAVWDRFAEAVTDVVRLAEARMDERCPYKSAGALCTFNGACENQRASAEAVGCAGDQLIVRAPHDQP